MDSQGDCCYPSHHTVVWLGYLVYCACVCLFVRLRISRRKNVAEWNFTCLFDYYPGRASPILVNFGSQGGTAVALLPGYTHRCTGATWRLQARLGGQSELGTAALHKAVWWDLHFASLLRHLLWSPYVIGQTIYIFMLWFVMVALWNRADHYIFALWLLLSFFLLFLFPRLISAVADWMSAILPHMVWP